MRSGSIRAVIVLTTLVMTACGGSSSPQSADAVHRAWVTALRDNQRAVLQDLIAPQDLQEAVVDDALRAMQATLQRADHGTLVAVDTQALSDLGANTAGISVWRFADGTAYCYRTELTAVDNAWKVLHFGGTGRCPT